MNKKISFGLMFTAIAVFSLMPDALSAVEQGKEVIKDFGGVALDKQATSISSFLFGPFLKVGGFLGAGYGAFRAFVTSDIVPLIKFGAIGLGVPALPHFVNSIFSILLP